MNSTTKTSAFCASDWTLLQPVWNIVHGDDPLHEIESLLGIARRRVLPTVPTVRFSKPQEIIACLEGLAIRYLNRANRWSEIRTTEKALKHNGFYSDENEEILKELEKERLSIESKVSGQERRILEKILELHRIIDEFDAFDAYVSSSKEER